MEILHVCPSRSFSGLEQYALELAKYQKTKGHDVAFVVCPATTLESECQRLDIKTVDFHYDSWRGRLFFWRRITRILAREANLKAVHLHMTDEVANISLPIFWRRIRNKWNNRPKIIFQAHIWMSHKKKDIYHRLLYSNIDEVWCSSEPAKKVLSESLPLQPEAIKIFNYGRDVKKIKEEILEKSDALKFLKLDKDRKVVGTVSRIEEAKGIRELVEAMVPLLESDPRLDLVVIGGPSPNNTNADAYFEKLLSDVEKLPSKIKEQIHFKGGIPESYRFLKAFDLYVLPSYLECFSLSVLDAQLAGLPVVGSQSGGTPEIVIENQTGWLFEPQNVSNLRSALEKALKNSEVWGRYGEKAKERVEKEFDQKNIFASIVQAYGDKMAIEKISAFLISHNEEKTIAKAIASLHWADEIIVVDGNSTDGTIKLCRDLGAKVIEVTGPQGRNLLECRNIALKECKYPWVFFLDADEICSPELITWLEEFKNQGEAVAAKETLSTPSQHPLGKAKVSRVDMYEIRRLEHFKGKIYRYGAGNPSHQWRLFRKTEGVHFTGLAHEYPVFEGEIRRIERPILHYPIVGLDGMMFKVNRASSFDAEEFFENGIIHPAPYMFFSGLAQFLKSYFRKQGFRDGVLGFILSVFDGGYFFLRQAKLYIKNKEAGRV